MHSLNIIISPSGNFYGSEQVLYDFLQNTTNKYDVFVPKDSLLKHKLQIQNKHQIFEFKNLFWLYSKLSVLLCFKYKTVYVNEGGHIRYIKLLSGIFKNHKFVVHLRIIEDAISPHLKTIRSNISLVVVSAFLKSYLSNQKNEMICLHDPFNPFVIKQKQLSNNAKVIKIGIIGRVTPTKGLAEIDLFISYTEKEKYPFEFHFFGNIESNLTEVSMFLEKVNSNIYSKCFFHGFVNSADEIYNSIDLVIHLNRKEPLGRICFESWSYGVPLIGFKNGGIGELSEALGVTNFTVDFKDGWQKKIFQKIFQIETIITTELINSVRNRMNEKFSSEHYTKQIDHLITE